MPAPTKQSRPKNTGTPRSNLNRDPASSKMPAGSLQDQTAGPPAVASAGPSPGRRRSARIQALAAQAQAAMTSDAASSTDESIKLASSGRLDAPVSATAQKGPDRDGDGGTLWVTTHLKPDRIFEVLDAGGWEYTITGTYEPSKWSKAMNGIAFFSVEYCDVETMETLKALDEVECAYFYRDRPEWTKTRDGDYELRGRFSRQTEDDDDSL